MATEFHSAARPAQEIRAGESGRELRSFWAAVLIGWLVLAAAGLSYARVRNIPSVAALPVLAAFLLEYPFYLIAGFASARSRLGRLGGARLTGFLAGSVLAPYLAYAVGSGLFSWSAMVWLAALAMGLALWYVMLPASPAADLGFLALIAAVLLRKSFQSLYPEPFPGLQTQILGHLALIHSSALVLLVERRVTGTGYGFVPSRRDWMIGAGHYAGFLVIGFPLALWLGVIRLGPPAAVWKIAGTFFAILWVVALSEEFFFRGLLQQWIEGWTANGHAALVLTAILFGLVHLPFRGFPNWRFALVAAIAGWFYGRAFRQAGSIRASMVTHALVVTTWRGFFS